MRGGWKANGVGAEEGKKCGGGGRKGGLKIWNESFEGRTCLQCESLSRGAVLHEADLAELAGAHHPQHLQVFEAYPWQRCRHPAIN